MEFIFSHQDAALLGFEVTVTIGALIAILLIAVGFFKYRAERKQFFWGGIVFFICMSLLGYSSLDRFYAIELTQEQITLHYTHPFRKKVSLKLSEIHDARFRLGRPASCGLVLYTQRKKLTSTHTRDLDQCKRFVRHLREIAIAANERS